MQPVPESLQLSAGMAVAFIGHNGPTPVDAVVDDVAFPFDSSVKVSIDGAKAAYVPRTELAMFCGGAADDLMCDVDAWTWM